MELLIIAGIVLIALAAMVIADRTSPRSSRGSGSVGSGVFGSIDEVFAPTKHEARLEMDRQTSLPAPAPAPGDGDRDIFEGRIRIRVADRDER